MRDLPSRGRCHAAFLLAYSARVRNCRDLNAWIAAALDKPTQMAASLDLIGTAHLLIDAGLARVDAKVLILGGLAKLDQVADLTTFKGIAQILLVCRPPDWLRSAVIDGCLAPEYIPEGDLKVIKWLGDELEAIVVSAHKKLYGAADEELLKLIGDAGELAVMSALRRLGHNPRHVSLVSDHFGYDIELDVGGRLHGLEVKTAVAKTAQRIVLSRNEFEVARRMGAQWTLIQVTFSSRILARRCATADDIVQFRELFSHLFFEMAPNDREEFRWIESAEFRPPDLAWSASDLVVGREFRFNL